MVKAFHKPKLLKMLEKHKVDKRVIKKILDQEGIRSQEYEITSHKKIQHLILIIHQGLQHH